MSDVQRPLMGIRQRVGDATITTVVEQELHGLNNLIPLATPEAVRAIDWLAPASASDNGVLHGVIQATVIEIGGAVVLVDTCIGNGKQIPIDPAWHDLDTDFLDRFRAAGFDESTVDYVICTHMHLDHVGWNTHRRDGAWVPTFPNATHVFCRAEFDHWTKVAETPLPDPIDDLEQRRQLLPQTQAHVHRESVLPVVEAGLAEFVDAPCEPTAGVRIVPTPGHTPGHVSIVVESAGEKVFITGDAFHHPCQIARPDWSTRADTDRDASTATRHRVLADLAGTDTLLFGSHFAPPGIGRIVRDGDTFRFNSTPTPSSELAAP
jgi:glyoxylase-like metal-dependent hydrolase (beta-lactamase superfamily II)